MSFLTQDATDIDIDELRPLSPAQDPEARRVWKKRSEHRKKVEQLPDEISRLKAELEEVRGEAVKADAQAELGDIAEEEHEAALDREQELERKIERKERALEKSEYILEAVDEKLAELYIEASNEIEERVRPTMMEVIEAWMHHVERAAELQQTLKDLRREPSSWNDIAHFRPGWPKSSIKLPPSVELRNLNPRKMESLKRKLESCGLDGFDPSL